MPPKGTAPSKRKGDDIRTPAPSQKRTKSVAASKGKGKEKVGDIPPQDEYTVQMNRPVAVYNGDRPFSKLSSRDLKVRWHRATGQLISSRDLDEFGLTPFETRIDELKALQAEVMFIITLIFVYIFSFLTF